MEKLENILNEIKMAAETGRYAPLRGVLETLEAPDIAWVLGRLGEEMAPVFRVLPKETAAEVFVEMEPDEQEFLIGNFTDPELKNIVDKLYNDDAADLVEEMPANVVKRILSQADPQKRSILNQLLQYPKGSAGSVMTTEYMTLKAEMTVEEAFDRIRTKGLDRETVYTCYVTDRNRKLEGVVTVREMLLARREERIGDLMDRNVVSFHTLDDREQVAQAFDQYDFLAFPVVDGENRLVGIVTVDDAMDILREENSEDIEIMAAIVPYEKPYLKTGTFETFRKRIPWLLVLMVSATFTGQIISYFENALAAQAVLISFIPMLMDTGGNSGSQAAVTVVRSLSLQEIRFKDIFRVIWKEARVALLCGVVLAAANFLKILLVDNLIFRSGVSVAVAAVVCVTLCCTVLLAKLVGCSLPMLAKKCGFDPAVMASPFITTVVDALSLILYFVFANAVLT